MLSYQFLVILGYKNDNITAFFTDKTLYSLTLKKEFLPRRGKNKKCHEGTKTQSKIRAFHFCDLVPWWLKYFL